jgi:acyl-CoA synthetase (AMP-forming)/AMP-acid ligase II
MDICEILARNARMYPDETALVECTSGQRKRRAITWREFDQMANRVANALIERGVGKNDKVLHLMFNSLEWLVTYFGIARTGAWNVPLNFRSTSEDIRYCAEVSEAKMMIFGEGFLDRVKMVRGYLGSVKEFVIVGEKTKEYANLDELIGPSSPESPGVEIAAEDICGLYFTSGTTGDPKPLLLSHKNMLCSAITNCVNDSKRHVDNFVFLAPLYHTGSKMRWFGNLIVGSRATMLIGVTPMDIFRVMSEEKGTILMMLVPWALDILQALERNELKLEQYDLSNWRLVTFGAQPVPPSLVRRWKERIPHVEVAIGYGLSEATGVGCLCVRPEEWQKAAITGKIKGAVIGRPGFNWEAHVVNEKGERLPPYEVGELLVRGDGIMTGYYKNPKKTAESLRDGWLYTGDLAEMDRDGVFFLVDRKKDVIISGGENIYPVEVEEVLHNHPKVKDVAIIGLPDDRLGEVAAAVVEVKPDVVLTEEEIRLFAEQNLPRYKRPKRFIFDSVPRNPTGKIQKPKLREKYGGSVSILDNVR